MPDGFSFRVSFREPGETFSYSSRTGDVAGFRDACEAAREAAAGRDEAEIGELLAGELRSRNIDLPPRVIGLLAAGIADRDASITVGGRDEVSGLTPERPGLAASLIGKAFGRLFARQITELTREVAGASPVLSRLGTRTGRTRACTSLGLADSPHRQR